MNTSNYFAQFFTFVFAFFMISQSTFAQEAQSNRIIVKKGIPDAPVVDIKVYNNPDGTYNLLAFNPTQHSLAFYDNDNYAINWRNEFVTISNNFIVNSVCGQQFQVTVLNKTTGAMGRATIIGLDCTPGDLQRRFRNKKSLRQTIAQ